MQAITTPQLVEKEIISSLRFQDQLRFDQHPDIQRQINEAVRLGNAYRTKVSILFHDDDGLKRVDTTIWAKGNRYICLKGGVWLPISRIVEIK